MERYSFGKAQEEAQKIREKLNESGVNDYSEAEQLIDQENVGKLFISDSFEFNEEGREGSWLTMSYGGKELEVERFSSPDPKDTILYVPGMPGSGVEWMKRRYLNSLLQDNSEVIILRHSGLKAEENLQCVANQKRTEQGGIIGSEKTSFKDWLSETLALIKHLSESRKDTKIVSHSVGGLLVALSLINKDNENISKWVNLSGAIDSFESFQDENVKEMLRQYIEHEVYPLYDFKESAGDVTSELIECLSELSKQLEEENAHINETRMISVYPEKDNLVNIRAGNNIQEALGHGLLVDDRTVHGSNHDALLEKDPFAIHDFPHLTEETFMRLIHMQVSKKPHEVIVIKN